MGSTWTLFIIPSAGLCVTNGAKVGLPQLHKNGILQNIMLIIYNNAIAGSIKNIYYTRKRNLILKH